MTLSRREFGDRLASADPARLSRRWFAPTWLVSLCLHAGLLALALIALPPITRGLPPPELDDAREVGILLKSDRDDKVVFENANEAFKPTPRPPNLDPPEIEEPTPEKNLTTTQSLPKLDADLLGTGSQTSQADAHSPSSPTEAAAGQSRTTFWNVEAIGQSFVFVIDRSASMAHRDALDLAKKELFQSVELLAPGSRFQIVFCNTESFMLTIGDGGLIDANPANIARAKREIERIVPEGGTDHVKPLMLAFGLRPEVSYFLSDADMLSERDANLLTAENRKANVPATLFAIEFGNGPSRGGDKPLRRLAAENDGTYSYLDVERFGTSLGSPE